MNNHITIRSYKPAKEQEILQFSLSYPWQPKWSKEHIVEFTKRLVSKQDLIFDCYNVNQRIAVAILIDKISNKGNNACLEILGLDQEECDLLYLYNIIINKAKTELETNRSGIEITIHDSKDSLLELLLQLDFHPYYETFAMYYEVNNNKTKKDKSDKIFPIAGQDYRECYQVMIESFKDNLDICIPSYDNWKLFQMELNKTLPQTWIYKNENRILGFMNLVVDDKSAEIRTFGVLPDFRGQGIGRLLLEFALNKIVDLSIGGCNLTVASKNKKALKLYKDLGFKIVEHYFVYCWKKSMR